MPTFCLFFFSSQKAFMRTILLRPSVCFVYQTGAEMFTDATKYTLVDDVVYEVEGKVRVIFISARFLPFCAHSRDRATIFWFENTHD